MNQGKGASLREVDEMGVRERQRNREICVISGLEPLRVSIKLISIQHVQYEWTF